MERDQVQTSYAGLAGRCALVTGSARGIGRTIADELSRQGANVAGLDIAWDGTTPDGMLAIECDTRDEDAVDRAFTRIESELGAPSILVNNAGIFAKGSILDETPAQWERLLSVNVTGAFLVTRRAIPGMREAGYGRIVSIGSNAGKFGGVVSTPAYAASKAALHSLTRSVALSEAAFGITANAIAAAAIHTEMLAEAGLVDDPPAIPVGRLGTPLDVANAVLFFASSDAGYLTGEILDLNGGLYVD